MQEITIGKSMTIRGKLTGDETLAVRINLELGEIGLSLPIDGEIKLG